MFTVFAPLWNPCMLSALPFHMEDSSESWDERVEKVGKVGGPSRLSGFDVIYLSRSPP